MTGADIPPGENAPPAVTIAASVKCPECGATLRNTLAEPGAKIRCLNCGARFNPSNAAGTAAVDALTPLGAPSPTAPVKKIREPRAAGYWFLRIPALIYAAAIFFVFMFTTFAACSALIYQFASGNFGPGRWVENFLPLVYLPLMPLSGYLFFVCARAPARIEAHSLKALWQRGLLQDSLTEVPGSSLPYIGPFIIGPACLVAGVAAVSMSDSAGYSRHGEVWFPAVIAALGGCVCALVCVDLRQFFWRQRGLAAAAFTAKNAAANNDAPVSRASRLGVYPALALALLATGLAIFSIASMVESREMMRTYMVRATVKGQPIDISESYYPDTEVGLMFSGISVLGIFAIAFTLYLLGSHCAAALRGWQRSAGKPKIDAPEFELSFILARVALVFFAIFGTIWILYLWSKTSGSLNEYRIIFEFGIFALWLGGLLACAALARTLGAVREWRAAQAQFWRQRGALGGFELSIFQQFVFYAGLLLAAGGTVVFMVLSLGLFRGMRGARLEYELV